MRAACVVAVALAVAPAGARASAVAEIAPPVRITDEPRSIVASVPRDLARAGALVFFQARTPDLGDEPWVTDGTAEGTHLVRDVWPGSGSGRLDFLAVIDDRLLFSAANPDSSIDVWSSDGTFDGTRVLVASAGRAGDFSGPRSATLWVGAQRRVGIRGDSGDVWLTDGTPEGTVAMDPSEADWYLAAAGDTVFTYRAGANGVRTLRRFDLATPQGVSIATFPAWNGTMTGAALGGVLYFTGYDAAHGVELWRSDGTEGGTWRVTDLVAGAASSSPSGLTLYDGDLYFASAGGSAATTRRELLRMDGVSGDVAPVSTAIASSAPHRIDALTVAGGRLYFVASGSSQYGTWATDGSSDGTHPLASGEPWTAEEGELQRDVFFEAQGLVHWVGDDVLWRSDGTPEGTEALLQGGAAELQRLDTGFVVAGPTLRRVDLDGDDPVVLADFSSAGRSEEPGARLAAAAGTRQLYATSDGTWSTAGGAGDAEQVSPQPLGPSASLGERAVVALSSGSAWPSFELWTTSGTSFGTTALDLAESGQTFTMPLNAPTPFVSLGDRALLRLADWSGAAGAWITDGTAAGSRSVGALGTSYLPCPVTRIGDHAIVHEIVYDFSDYDRVWGVPLEAGDPVVLPLLDRAFGCYPVVANGFLYTAASVDEDESWYVTLVRTDGTVAGTEALGDVLPATGGFDLAPVGAIGDVVLFRTWPNGLWCTDGTAAGTAALHVAAGPESHDGPFSDAAIAFGGGLVFAYDDGVHGSELWRSDGTPDGTVLVADLYAGPFGGAPKSFVVADGVLYFTACTESGCEPWLSDGTTEGTRLWADIIPGSGGSDPSELRKTGGRVYFTAYDGESRQVFVPEPVSAALAAIALASIAALARRTRALR